MYYVYCYCDPRVKVNRSYGAMSKIFKHEPFYIGKGQRDRSEILLRSSISDMEGNPWKFDYEDPKCSRVRDILNDRMEPEIHKLAVFEGETEAYSYEKYVVSQIGRVCTSDGPLFNIADGGRVPYIYDKKSVLEGSHIRSKYSYILVSPESDLHYVSKGQIRIVCEELRLDAKSLKLSSWRVRHSHERVKVFAGASAGWFAVRFTREILGDLYQALDEHLTSKGYVTREVLDEVPRHHGYDEKWVKRNKEIHSKLWVAHNPMHNEVSKRKLFSTRVENSAKKNGFESNEQAVSVINSLDSRDMSRTDISKELGVSLNFVRVRLKKDSAYDTRYDVIDPRLFDTHYERFISCKSTQ